MLKSRISRFILAIIAAMMVTSAGIPALCVSAVVTTEMPTDEDIFYYSDAQDNDSGEDASSREGYWFDDEKNLYYGDKLISEYDPNPVLVDYVDPRTINDTKTCDPAYTMGFGKNLDSDGAGEYDPGEPALPKDSADAMDFGKNLDSDGAGKYDESVDPPDPSNSSDFTGVGKVFGATPPPSMFAKESDYWMDDDGNIFAPNGDLVMQAAREHAEIVYSKEIDKPIDDPDNASKFMLVTISIIAIIVAGISIKRNHSKKRSADNADDGSYYSE